MNLIARIENHAFANVEVKLVEMDGHYYILKRRNNHLVLSAIRPTLKAAYEYFNSVAESMSFGFDPGETLYKITNEELLNTLEEMDVDVMNVNMPKLIKFVKDSIGFPDYQAEIRRCVTDYLELYGKEK